VVAQCLRVVVYDGVRMISYIKDKGKVKFAPRTGPEGPEGE
jgi:hypothetical protein